MLAELSIENFAIIDHLEITFRPGFITFTGETGAGKSIIIDAVELLLGGRAENSMVRTGAERAIVEATFQIEDSNRAQILSILEREALLDTSDHFSIGREIRAGGRSVARLNGRNVNVSLLKEIGELLVDVHGQSEHLSLLRVREHINLLDRFAGHEDLLSAYSQTYQRLTKLQKELDRLRLAESEAARQIDLLNYQINEIESARLNPDEEEDLISERTRLANAESLASTAQEALLNLDEGTPESPSVTDLMGKVLDAINELSRIDRSQNKLAEDVESTFSNITDITVEIRSYIEGIEYNPKLLNQVEERLDLIANLKRKYGNSISAVLDYLAEAQAEKETITHAGERIAELQAQESDLLKELERRAQTLSNSRKTAAKKLEKEIEDELNELSMSGAQFKVNIESKENQDGLLNSDGRRLAYDSTGIDQLEFLIEPNPGEGLKPLVRIASGGETSRLMLALKNVLARADHIPTLIFDEIDQGIGGRVGTVVGHKLWLLARHHQVLCVTHLPQLAAFGEQHIQVSKQIQAGRTTTQITDLGHDARLNELADMLGETSDSTMHSARDMLQTASNLTEHIHE